jgi:hypothetical protein
MINFFKLVKLIKEISKPIMFKIYKQKLKRFLRLKVKSKIAEEDLISYETKRIILDKYRQIYNVTTFVETGTFLGDTVEFFKNKFVKLVSIELSEDLFIRASQRFSDNNNVQILHGDSGKIFETLLPTFTIPTLFWLDGHYSSEFFLNDEYVSTAKGERNTPIEKEIELLLNCDIPHIILVDDARLFIGKNDYPTISHLKNMLYDYPYQLFVDSDIIHILPKN